MHMNHSGRAATAKSAPVVASAEPAIEPHSATPILTPTCRLVDVTADAAPARSVGIPLTAALVIGALTIAKPMPNTAKITRIPQTGVVDGQLRQHDRRRRDQSPGDQQRRAAAEAADHSAGQRRKDQCANGNRQIDQAGVHRRVAALALQVQRHHEQERTLGGERAHRGHRRRGEGHAAEEAKIDERVVPAGLVAQEARRTRSARRRRPRACRGFAPAHASGPR